MLKRFLPSLSLLRRVIAFYLAVCVGFFSCVTPAHAFAPVVVPALIEAFAAVVVRDVARRGVLSLGVAANDASWATAVGMSGSTMAILGIGAVVSTASEPVEKYQVAVVESANSGLLKAPVVVGAEGTAENPLHVVSPSIRYRVTGSNTCLILSSGSTDGQYHYVAAGVYKSWADLMAACQALEVYINYAHEPFSWFENGGVYQVSVSPPVYVSRASICFGVSSGHVPDGCNDRFGAGVYPETQEPKDGVYRVKRFGDGWLADPTDPDWTEEEKTKLGTASPLQWQGTTPAAQPLAVEVVKTTTHVVIRSRVQKDANNIQSRQIAIDPSTLNPTSAEEAVSPGTDVKSSPDPGTNGNSETGSWPDDYSREGTLQAAKAGIDQLHKDLTDQQSTDDPSRPADSVFTDAYFNGTFDTLKTWSLPGHTSACPTGSFVWNSVTYTMDVHCQLFNDHMSTIQAAMAVVWSILALFIVMRA